MVDVSDLDEIGEDAIEIVGELGEKIEDMELGMKGAFVAKGEEADMWKNLDGCEEWLICKTVEEAKSALSGQESSAEN